MSTIIRCHKIRLDPNNVQEEFFWKCVGTARFAYNWGLAEWKQQFEAGEKPNEMALRRKLNTIKKTQFPWMYEVPKTVVQQAIKNLGAAYQRMFKKQARFPKFKRRHNAKQAARLDNGPGTFTFDGKSVRLPKIGWIKTFEPLRWPEGRPISAILRREGERWFLSVGVEIDQPKVVESQDLPVVGIDLGLESAVTFSTGEKVAAPKALRRNLGKLARLQRRLAKKKPGSRNRIKAKAKLARLHWHIAQMRYDWQHKLTSRIAQKFGRVCLEDLSIKGMMKNHCLALSIADVGWGELVRQLSYKMPVQKVNRWFASSKTCSCCGHKVESLPLNVRSWTCDKCGTTHDRDINAAKNILAEGNRIFTASCAGINACGEERSGQDLTVSAKRSSLKQESRMYYLILK